MEQKRKQLLMMSIGGFAVMAASFLLMPLELGGLPGVLFWSGLLLGCLCQWSLRSKEKRSIKEWGVFTFFSSKTGRIVDTSMIVLAAAATAAVAFDGYGYICFVLLAAVVFAFSLHCIVNSKSFAETAAALEQRQKAENEKQNVKKGGSKTR